MNKYIIVVDVQKITFELLEKAAFMKKILDDKFINDGSNTIIKTSFDDLTTTINKLYNAVFGKE